MKRRAIFLLTCAIGMAATVGVAQSALGPAELPPTDFSGSQFVDSSGCAFVRATVNSVDSWIPRVDRDRNPICNFEPTFAAAEPSAAEEVPVERAVQAETAEAETEVGAANEGQEALADADTAEEAAPAVDAEEVVSTTEPVARPAPRTAPRRTPAPVRATAPAAPSVPQVTGPISFEEACAGRSGTQADFISSTTGMALDCGPGDTIAAPAPASSADVPRLTLAEICARMASSNVQYVNAETGAAIECAGPAQQTSQSASTSAAVDRTFIQVGSFAVPSNAERLIQRLGEMGLPVASGRSGGLRIVAAGPFSDAAAQQQALAMVRGLGFHDAFLRN